MNGISYSAHISNKKSAITSKGKLATVAKHNLRKYRTSGYSSDNILLIYGTDNLMKDVRSVYSKQFDKVLKEYNSRQTRADRKIDNYFNHISEKGQDMAVEIIIQCGDKKFWEEHDSDRIFMRSVYKFLLNKLKNYLPDFVIANAVIHFDEASPHMHIVGVPVGHGFKRGLETKVSKRSVFTKETLSTILQDRLREDADCYMQQIFDMEISKKKKGKNHDLTVTEYKVAKEQKKLEKMNEQFEYGYMEVGKLDEMIKNKEKKIEILDDEIRENSKFINAVSKIKKFIISYLPFVPFMEEFANRVERREKPMLVGNRFAGIMSEFGEFINSFKEVIKEEVCWFPRLMRWKTSKGEVTPIFTDKNEGYSYDLKGYGEVNICEMFETDELKDEIVSENRVGTFEQLTESIEAIEKQVEMLNRDKDREYIR